MLQSDVGGSFRLLHPYHANNYLLPYESPQEKSKRRKAALLTQGAFSTSGQSAHCVGVSISALADTVESKKGLALLIESVIMLMRSRPPLHRVKSLPKNFQYFSALIVDSFYRRRHTNDGKLVTENVLTVIAKQGVLQLHHIEQRFFVCDNIYGEVVHAEDPYLGALNASTEITECRVGHAYNLIVRTYHSITPPGKKGERKEKECGTGPLPCPGVHIIMMDAKRAAVDVSRFRSLLQAYIQRMRGQRCYMLRPMGKYGTNNAHFLYVGNYGQTGITSPQDEERNINSDDELLIPSQLPSSNNQQIEALWNVHSRSHSQGGDNATAAQQDPFYIAVKVDTWRNARMLCNELPKLSTKHVIVNVVGCSFGPLTTADIEKFSRSPGSQQQTHKIDLILGFRNPKLMSAHVMKYLEQTQQKYVEYDVFTDAIEELKAQILQRQTALLTQQYPAQKKTKDYLSSVVRFALGA